MKKTNVLSSGPRPKRKYEFLLERGKTKLSSPIAGRVGVFCEVIGRMFNQLQIGWDMRVELQIPPSV